MVFASTEKADNIKKKWGRKEFLFYLEGGG